MTADCLLGSSQSLLKMTVKTFFGSRLPATERKRALPTHRPLPETNRNASERPKRVPFIVSELEAPRQLLCKLLKFSSNATIL